MASTWYRYEPLPSESSFRLFHLKRQPHPTQPDVIKIDLFDATFEDPPKYEAVSYAWGQDNSDSTILCNGQLLRVSSGVVSILQALQRDDSTGILWIDSICINQTSIPEKNAQVRRMGTIYRQAEKVWIWLGKGSYETDAALHYMVGVASLLKRCEIVEDYDVSKETDPEAAKFWDDEYPSIEADLKRLHDTFTAHVRERRGVYDAMDTSFVIDVLNLPWFHRTWTVQELALAKQVVLLCGSMSLPWLQFNDTLHTLDMNGNGPPSPSLKLSFSNLLFLENFTSCYRTLSALARGPSYGLEISRALKTLRPKLSSDPKDKVYGLYGIFENIGLPGLPAVDYNKTVEHIYTEVATAAIKHERSLAILYEVCLPPLIPGLPSWVPDWSNTNFFQDDYPSLYDASKQSEPCYYIDGHQLAVSGIVIDLLLEVANSTSFCSADFRRGYNVRTQLGNQDERHSAVIELIRTLQAWVRVSRQLNSYPTGESPLEAFLQTIKPMPDPEPRPEYRLSADFTLRKWISILTANFPDNSINLQELQSEVEILAGYEQIRDNYIGLFGYSTKVEDWPDELRIRFFLRVDNNAVAEVQQEIGSRTYHRTFFTTRDGYMGTAPRSAKLGDLVVLIAGLDFPFIVRKNGESYSLIGPAFIHGVMKGERWDDAQLEKIVLV